MSRELAREDPWASLRQHTAARIALGRAGASLPTRELLGFSYDHAEARDAVHSELDLVRLGAEFGRLGLPVVTVASRAPDRFTYLQRPDLGCELDDRSRGEIEAISKANLDGFDIVLIVADGLSASAAQLHAVAVVLPLVGLLQKDRRRLGPLVLARMARVGLEDEIGHLLRARASLILLGERPGLGAADSLGGYLVFNPRPGNSNAQRNCVSNIRPKGLPPSAAADTLHYLLTESLRRQISGVGLKDERSGNLRQILDNQKSVI
jgi:ethanolamine ammonia-lyase small subunit